MVDEVNRPDAPYARSRLQVGEDLGLLGLDLLVGDQPASFSWPSSSSRSVGSFAAACAAASASASTFSAM
jgi:hypothetical protein